jgi:hypothetical protein
MRKLHNEELNDWYCSPNIITVITSKRMRWVVHVARVGEERSSYGIFVGKPQEKRLLGRPWNKWEDNIRTGLQKEWEQTAWNRFISLPPIKSSLRFLKHAI